MFTSHATKYLTLKTGRLTQMVVEEPTDKMVAMGKMDKMVQMPSQNLLENNLIKCFRFQVPPVLTGLPTEKWESH